MRTRDAAGKSPYDDSASPGSETAQCSPAGGIVGGLGGVVRAHLMFLWVMAGMPLSAHIYWGEIYSACTWLVKAVEGRATRPSAISRSVATLADITGWCPLVRHLLGGKILPTWLRRFRCSGSGRR